MKVTATGLAAAALLLWGAILFAAYKLDVHAYTYRGHSTNLTGNVEVAVVTLVLVACFGLTLIAMLLLRKGRVLSSMTITVPLVTLGGYLFFGLEGWHGLCPMCGD